MHWQGNLGILGSIVQKYSLHVLKPMNDPGKMTVWMSVFTLTVSPQQGCIKSMPHHQNLPLDVEDMHHFLTYEMILILFVLLLEWNVFVLMTTVHKMMNSISTNWFIESMLLDLSHGPPFLVWGCSVTGKSMKIYVLQASHKYRCWWQLFTVWWRQWHHESSTKGSLLRPSSYRQPTRLILSTPMTTSIWEHSSHSVWTIFIIRYIYGDI